MNGERDDVSPDRVALTGRSLSSQVSLFVILAAWTIGADRFDCSYEICTSATEGGRTSIGCVVVCSFDGIVTVSGDCVEIFGLMTGWIASDSTVERDVVGLMKVGLAYYFVGYLVRVVNEKTSADSLGGLGPSSSLKGSGRCWTESNGTRIGGDASLDVGSVGSYSFRACLSGGERDCGWTSTSGTEVPETIARERARDDDFFRLCPRILKIFAERTRRALVGTRGPCVGRNATSPRRELWAKWTKYSELGGLGFLDPTFARAGIASSFSPRQRSETIVTFVVVIVGAVTLLVTICVLSLKRRNEIIKDLRGRSSFRSRSRIVRS
uniref:M37 n=1 Tax=Lemniscomys rat herpesvirus TaxID=3141920 RepID=A0AAU7E292_9VIRU